MNQIKKGQEFDNLQNYVIFKKKTKKLLKK